MPCVWQDLNSGRCQWLSEKALHKLWPKCWWYSSNKGCIGTTYTTSYISGSIRSNSRTFNDLALGSKQDKDDFCKFIYCVQRTFILLLHECYFPRTCIRLCLAHLNVHCMCAYVIVCVCIHWCERVCIACVCACVLGYVWVCLCLYMHVCLDCFLHWCCMFKL